jgi:hypothetical protein
MLVLGLQTFFSSLSLFANINLKQNFDRKCILGYLKEPPSIAGGSSHDNGHPFLPECKRDATILRFHVMWYSFGGPVLVGPVAVGFKHEALQHLHCS